MSNAESQHSERPRRRGGAWNALAIGVFALGVATVFGRVVVGGFQDVVLTEREPRPLVGSDDLPQGALDVWARLLEADRRFTVWGTARNARTFATAPLAMFDAEPCYPADNVLAMGHPLTTFGLLGLPAWLVTQDPVATYNVVTMILPLLAAFAMYLLVRFMTGVPAAGIAAGLLYGFSAMKLGNAVHPLSEDTGWTVLGMLFLTRFFQEGRMRHGLLAAAAYGLQLGSSFYALLTSLAVSAPYALWLLWRYRLHALRPLGAVASMGVMAAFVWLTLSPYLALQASEPAVDRVRIYSSWDDVVPGGFAGVLMLALAAFALVRRSTRSLDRGFLERGRNVPWVIAAMALLCALMATGGNVNARTIAERSGEAIPIALPNLYEMFAAAVPALNMVRVASYADGGTLLALCALAGIGIAAAVRIAPPRLRSAAAVTAVTAAWLATLGVPWLGWEPGVAFGTEQIRPRDETLAFFDELADRGDEGPILELPIGVGLKRAIVGSRRQLLSAYHGRRTSGCYNSFIPESTRAAGLVADGLPAAEAVRTLAALGFTTIVVHHAGGPLDRGKALNNELSETAARARAPLQKLHETRRMTAYRIARED